MQLFFDTFRYRFSGLVGALGGGLSGLSGYNGLPSVLSGLDDSLSDIGVRKKYPFELEKAIHNVMFIQHHMQRQDEFNAVSVSDIHISAFHFLCKSPDKNYDYARFINQYIPLIDDK